MNKLLNIILRPLCWIGWHPMRSAAGPHHIRCDSCGRYVK